MDLTSSAAMWAAFSAMFTAWGIASVWVPALSPMIGSMLILLTDDIRVRHDAHRTPSSEVKALLAAPYVDGQLGYVALAWCAAGLFEMGTLRTCVPDTKYEMFAAFLYVGAFIGAMIAAAGAVPGTLPLKKRGKSLPKLPPRSLGGRPFLWSLGISVIACFLMSCVHTTLDASIKGEITCQKSRMAFQKAPFAWFPT
ncbi:hypothetical protein [Pararobbsia alpina]|jgi:hypothetical protein|uniref:hypothetical protein n=1 Tax=Pararobbsia alpina TaxID=621374 RepID=UPI0039A53A7A